MYYKGAKAAIVVYDITNYVEFGKFRYWVMIGNFYESKRMVDSFFDWIPIGLG